MKGIQGRFFLAAVSIVATCYFKAYGQQQGFDWPMWRYDAARSAASPQKLEPELHLQWVWELPAPRRAWRHQWDHRGKLDFDISFAPVVMGERDCLIGVRARH